MSGGHRKTPGRRAVTDLAGRTFIVRVCVGLNPQVALPKTVAARAYIANGTRAGIVTTACPVTIPRADPVPAAFAVRVLAVRDRSASAFGVLNIAAVATGRANVLAADPVDAVVACALTIERTSRSVVQIADAF